MSLAVFIADQRTSHRVPHAVACRALAVSESWFYTWLEAGVRAVVFAANRMADAVATSAFSDFYRLLRSGSSVAHAVAQVNAADPFNGRSSAPERPRPHR